MRQMVGNGKLVCNSPGLELWILSSCSQSGTYQVEWNEDVFGGLYPLTPKCCMFALSKHWTQLCCISQNHLLLFSNEQTSLDSLQDLLSSARFFLFFVFLSFIG